MQNYYSPYQFQYQYQPQQVAGQMPQQMAGAPMSVQGQQPQIQNGGFVSVRNETEARGYPVAPGNSVTFKDETAPYVYTKTMGFSQLDRPIFEKYRLVRETPSEAVQTFQDANNTPSAKIYTIEDAERDIGQIRADLDGLKSDLEKRVANNGKSKEKEES